MKAHTCCIPKVLLMSVFFLYCLIWQCPAYSAETSRHGREELLEKFHQLDKKSAYSLPGISAYLDSYSEKNISGVDIYGVIEYPFEFVEKEFIEHANWCNIVILNPNIKACTHRGTDNNRRLIFFNVDKAEKTLADASLIEFKWKMTRHPGYFDIVLSALEGPYSTRDNRLELEAAPRDEHSTVVHLSYSYEYGALANVFIKSYFAIFGRSKVGFSVTGTDSRNNPEYVSGIRGLNERNIVRYYLAALAYLEMHYLPDEHGFEKSLDRWYDLASQYKIQLSPGEKKDYIARKKLDLKNQLQLQEAAGNQLN